MVSKEDQIEEILAKQSSEIRAIVAKLRKIIKTAAPNLSEEPKTGWKNITYKGKAIVGNITPYKNHVNLHLYRGTELDDSANLLEGSGKTLRHIKFHQLESLEEKVIAAYITQAVALDDAGR